ncbi:chemotaxis protein CheW [Ramlibacter humi]|uniref:Chemotaxis protein CheW n=1 Tax=Ramlibacter humi TaxID=2530451 RepID=A0A4Z0CC05_9BURK|nr:chemotaxis protein CheW [Ramlibacter humi]TFZ07715.1 chemotaxis protein CheW [Ramlibacter humi]
MSNSAAARRLVAFRLGSGRHAVALAAVQRVLAAAAVTPLPAAAPEGVLGVLDVAGQVLPVYAARERFGLPAKPLEPDDQFLLLRTPRRLLALVVDEALGVIECDAAVLDAAALVPGLQRPAGVARLPDGLLLVHDVELLLSPSQEEALVVALEGRT